jgi:nucleoside diphosphate kinase
VTKLCTKAPAPHSLTTIANNSRFEAKGYALKALKLTTPSKETLAEHYKDLSGKVRLHHH